MALRIRFQYPTGSKLNFSIERLSDGTYYDFSGGSFTASPTTMFQSLPEDVAPLTGRYKTTLTPTPNTVFTDGDYVVSIQDQVASTVVAELGTTMCSGDDASVLPTVASIPTVGDGGFESPIIGTGNFQAAPSGSPWVFVGSANNASGISGNASPFTSGNPSAPAGTQIGYLQTTSSFSQSIANWTAGHYLIAFQAAQRGNNGISNHDFTVQVDGTVVGTVKPSGTSYAWYLTNPFSVAAGNHTVAFVGLNSAKGDNTSFIDQIQIFGC